MLNRFIKAIERLSGPVIAVCLLIIVSMDYVRPWIATRWYADQFRALAAECDTAMHDEVALRDESVGGKQHLDLERSAQVELSVCHHYDKLQKHLLLLGVTQDQLALWGLEALESEDIPVSRLVAPHRMDHL